MKLNEIAKIMEFKLLTQGTDTEREVGDVYACDLLSWVMGTAPSDNLWFTVMGNVNAIAVASLSDVSGIVLTENASLDADAKARAEQNDIAVYQTSLKTAQALIKVDKLLK